MTTLLISNKEMEDIMKIVKSKSLEDQGLLIKGINKTIKNEAKEQKGALRKQCPNTEFFLVRVFLHSD